MKIILDGMLWIEKEKEKGCGNELLIMKMLLKNRIYFFGLCKNNGFLVGLNNN